MPRSGRCLEAVYAPFEHIEHGAELVIVGITPGQTQAENALKAARTALRRGADPTTAAREAKVAASFSGEMRSFLCEMLDAAGAQQWFGIRRSSELFAAAAHRVHFTSALRNPVFLSGENYNGQPKILSHRRLLEIVETCLVEEAYALPNAYWLPLWDGPAAVLNHLVSRGTLKAERVLAPMPHPSKQNGENVVWFCGRNTKAAFSSRRASTGPLLLERRDRLKAFFAIPPESRTA
ncbi:hypothetical protein HMPREF0731_0686 [Pseudoroseomonas cervicalis ATCC 49957]|uniref:Uracil-DNA glycosylase-like domain-containing protein n=2 Tax=Teichococcus cervicalis TaxID=204525 RepID=D5RHX6_9PROT|nr:hypothetical protein HMPREF0731_0686 [Pseudoroseomonas cervicalis ATCC 49957]